MVAAPTLAPRFAFACEAQRLPCARLLHVAGLHRALVMPLCERQRHLVLQMTALVLPAS